MSPQNERNRLFSTCSLERDIHAGRTCSFYGALWSHFGWHCTTRPALRDAGCIRFPFFLLTPFELGCWFLILHLRFQVFFPR